jgi:poly(A) polymerase Pap1
MWRKIIGKKCRIAVCIFSLLLGLLNLMGCASASGRTVASPVITGTPVSMDNIVVTTFSTLDDLETEKHTLRDAIFSGLNETRMFTRVTTDRAQIGAGSGVALQVEIKAIKKVSEKAREWRGPLAGRARILIRVTVADLNSGKQIEVFEAEGESGQSAYAGTTDEAIERVAEQVVAHMLKLNAELANKGL